MALIEIVKLFTNAKAFSDTPKAIGAFGLAHNYLLELKPLEMTRYRSRLFCRFGDQLHMPFLKLNEETDNRGRRYILRSTCQKNAMKSLKPLNQDTRP